MEQKIRCTFTKSKNLIRKFMIKQFCNKQMKLVDQSNLFNRLNELISVGFSIKDSITFLCNTTNSSKLSLAEKKG